MFAEETLSPVLRDTLLTFHHFSYATEFVELGERCEIRKMEMELDEDCKDTEYLALRANLNMVRLSSLPPNCARLDPSQT